MKLYGKIMVPMMFLLFLGIAAVAFSGYLLSVRALEAAGAQALSAAEIAASTRRVGIVSAGVALGVLAVAGVAMLLLLRSIVKPVKGVAKVLVRRSELDFTIDRADLWMIDRSKANDEIAQMIKALIALRVNVEEMVHAIRSRSESFSKSAESLASLSETTVASMQEVKSSIETVFSLSEENADGIRQTAEGLGTVAASASTASTASSEGAAVVAETSRTSGQAVGKVEKVIAKIRAVGARTEESARSMGGVATSVESISNFVATIKSIADQTNLLALNAAIEAARAGETGRGFAVVADEVRKLAEESNHAAKEVEVLITSLQQETKRAMDATNEAGGVMKETVGEAEAAQTELTEALERIERMNALMSSLAEAAGKQEAAAREMTLDIERASSGTASLTETFSGIRSAAEDTAGVSESVAREASDLAEGARELQTAVRRFRIEEKASATAGLKLLK